MTQLGELEVDEEVMRRIAEIEEHIDMLETPRWKKFIFWLNGWPFNGRPVAASEQKWRYWHRWCGRRDGRINGN